MSRIGLVIVAAMLALVVPAHAHALEEPPVVATPDRDTTIREISDGVYVVTHAFPWPANSLIVLCGDGDAAMIDTPYTPEATRLVLEWLFATHGDRNVVAVVTGFHFDNLGGVSELRDRGIPVWGSDRTAELIHERGEESRELFLSWLAAPRVRRFHDAYRSLAYVAPDRLFPLAEGADLELDGEPVRIIFPGESHSPDNVVVYFPRRRLLFGGCMLLGNDAVGNTVDANVSAWDDSVERLLELPVELAVPGHGLRFDPGIIEHTIDLIRSVWR